MTTYAVTYLIIATNELRTIHVPGLNIDDAKIRARKVDSQVNFGNAEFVAIREERAFMQAVNL